jgi:hypothetical protein
LNYLHIEDSLSGEIYGFKRYGGNNPEYLLDILDNNGIQWCDEYDIGECYPYYELAELFGVDVDDDDKYDDFCDVILDKWAAEDYHWACVDGVEDEFLQSWFEEHKSVIQDLYK